MLEIQQDETMDFFGLPQQKVVFFSKKMLRSFRVSGQCAAFATRVLESPCARRRSTCPHSWMMCVVPRTRTNTAALFFFGHQLFWIDSFPILVVTDTHKKSQERLVLVTDSIPKSDRSFLLRSRSGTESDHSSFVRSYVRSFVLCFSLSLKKKKKTHRIANDVQSDVLLNNIILTQSVVYRGCLFPTGWGCVFKFHRSAETSLRRFFFSFYTTKKNSRAHTSAEQKVSAADAKEDSGKTKESSEPNAFRAPHRCISSG